MTPREIYFKCQSVGVNLELIEGNKLEATGSLTPELRNLLKDNLAKVKAYLLKTNSIARLPYQLERLVHAATNRQLKLSIRGVVDVNQYVQAWACSYLVSNKPEALNRLWVAHKAWQEYEVN